MEIKQKILKELEKKEFPNMKFLFSDEVLDISLKLLEELLDVDKKRFNNLLKTEEIIGFFRLIAFFAKIFNINIGV